MNEVSENFGLLTCEQFRTVRDEIALESMLERGNDLYHQSDAAWTESRALKKRMEAMDKHKRQAIEADYNAAMKRWAKTEADMGTILNDERYKQWAANRQRKAAGE